MMATSFFISRAMIIINSKTKMTQWRGRLFLGLSKNAMNAADFFRYQPTVSSRWALG